MAKKVVLISCVSKKRNQRSKAKDLYISPLFKLNLKYAYSLTPNIILILSAKYGLLDLETEVEPYDLTLNSMREKEIKDWAQVVIEQLKAKTDLIDDHFVFLAGYKYRKYLIPFIKSYEIPLEGLAIGKQLQSLKRRL